MENSYGSSCAHRAADGEATEPGSILAPATALKAIHSVLIILAHGWPFALMTLKFISTSAINMSE